MTRLEDKILIRKTLLNILLKYLSPTSSLIVYISQDLDKLIFLSQKKLYSKYLKRTRKISLDYKRLIHLRNVA